jgi:hypothetical protein
VTGFEKVCGLLNRIKWWAGRDLNPRRRESTDLQSVAFDRSATCPVGRCGEPGLPAGRITMQDRIRITSESARFTRGRIAADWRTLFAAGRPRKSVHGWKWQAGAKYAS